MHRAKPKHAKRNTRNKKITIKNKDREVNKIPKGRRKDSTAQNHGLRGEALTGKQTNVCKKGEGTEERSTTQIRSLRGEAHSHNK